MEFRMIVNKTNKIILLILVLSTISYNANAQRSKLRDSISNFLFDRNYIFKDTPDSNETYAFFFQIDVIRNQDHSCTAISVVASDTTAYRIFPRYMQLKEFDFSTLMGGRKNASIIVPIWLEVSYNGSFQPPAERVVELAMALYPRDQNFERYIHFNVLPFRIDKSVYD